MALKPTLLVLAAGMGSRYKGLKQIEAVGPHGETLLDYSLYGAIRESFGRIVFIIREAIREPFQRIIGQKYEDHIEVEYVYQAELLFADFLVKRGMEGEKEFYISAAIDALIGRNLARVKVLQTPDLWFGITYREDKPFVINRIKSLTERGEYPEVLFD